LKWIVLAPVDFQCEVPFPHVPPGEMGLELFQSRNRLGSLLGLDGLRDLVARHESRLVTVTMDYDPQALGNWQDVELRLSGLSPMAPEAVLTLVTIGGSTLKPAGETLGAVRLESTNYGTTTVITDNARADLWLYLSGPSDQVALRSVRPIRPEVPWIVAGAPEAEKPQEKGLDNDE
jgi:hypothetical protein